MTELTEKKNVPQHVAVIMDGNGRWAEKNGVSRLAGHNAGMLAMKEIVKRDIPINKIIISKSPSIRIIFIKKGGSVFLI